MRPPATRPVHPGRLRDDLAQIVESIERIQRYTAGMGLADFLADRKNRDAVMRNFGVLGRLAGHIEQYEPDYTARHSCVPWACLKAVRQLANRPYFAVDDEAVWHSIHDNLPPLQRALKALLDPTSMP